MQLHQEMRADRNVEGFRRMGDLGALRVRIMSYSAGLGPAIAAAGQGPTPWLYDDKLRMGGIKLLADGAGEVDGFDAHRRRV